MSASSNALEASIPAFSAVKDREVASSPSGAVKNKRSADSYLFAVVKTPQFASAPHVISCIGRFQRRAGSINRLVLNCKRWRRYFVALSALKQQKIGKQVFVCRRENAPVCIRPAYNKLHWALPATGWKHESIRLQLQERVTLPCRPLHPQITKDRQTGICLP